MLRSRLIIVPFGCELRGFAAVYDIYETPCPNVFRVVQLAFVAPEKVAKTLMSGLLLKELKKGLGF